MPSNASEDANGSIGSQTTSTVRVASSAPASPIIVSSGMSSAAKDRSSYPKPTCNNEASSNTPSTTDSQDTPAGSSRESNHDNSSPPPNSSRHDKNDTNDKNTKTVKDVKDDENVQEDTSKDESLKKARADRTKEAPSASNAQGLFFPNACVFVGNLACKVSTEEHIKDLNDLFSQIGPCYSKVKINYVKRLPYGLVQFEDPENAKKALDWHQTTRLRGRPLRIEMCYGKTCGFIGLRSREDMKRDKVSVLKNYGNIKNAVKVSFANHQIVYQVQFYFVDDFNDARKGLKNDSTYFFLEADDARVSDPFFEPAYNLQTNWQAQQYPGYEYQQDDQQNWHPQFYPMLPYQQPFQPYPQFQIDQHPPGCRCPPCWAYHPAGCRCQGCCFQAPPPPPPPMFPPPPPWGPPPVPWGLPPPPWGGFASPMAGPPASGPPPPADNGQ